MSDGKKTTPPGSGSGGTPPGCTTGCPPPVVHAALTIKEITFSGNHIVEKDTLGNFPSPEWLEGRAQPNQSPICYTRKTRVSLLAKFRVTRQPSSTESVEIKGRATFGSATLEWTSTVSVSPADTEVTAPSMTSNADLVDQVDLFESNDINWEHNPASTGWAGAGTSRNVLYVVLGSPTGTPAYWTLLDISCRAAKAKKTAADVISSGFVPFTGRSLKRKRDGHALTYWNPRTTTATNTQELLAAADGSGQCGSWAEFLVDMYKVHGIISGDKILVVRTQSDWLASRIGFLVKHWTFNHPPASSATSFTHTLNIEVVETPGVPGQSSPNPPPAFYNHFIVRIGGKFYDPSYGAGPIATQVLWEGSSIDGLFQHAPAMGGFDKSLPAIASAKILEFWNLTTSTLIP